MTLVHRSKHTVSPAVEYNPSVRSCIEIRRFGLDTVSHLLGSARRLEALAMREHAERLRTVADLVAAEYCHISLDDMHERQIYFIEPATIGTQPIPPEAVRPELSSLGLKAAT